MSTRQELEHFTVTFRFGNEATDRMVAAILGTSRDTVTDTIENRFQDKGFFRWEEGGKTFSVNASAVRCFIVDESPEAEQRARDEALAEKRLNAGTVSLKGMA
ncbi:MAG: hypothetical protein V4671_27525 [Armatimonadota bacterium]